MRRRLFLLLFVFALTGVSLGGSLAPQAQASCTRHCTLVNCGWECCTYEDCTTHCFNVFCGA